MARRKAAATQSFDLVISNMPVHIERKNIRRAWLRVKADGSVQVSAPYTMSTKKLNEFVSSHTGWIEQQQLKQQARRAHTAQWLEGEKLSLWGVNYPIRWREALDDSSSISFEHGEIVMTLTESGSSHDDTGLAIRTELIDSLLKAECTRQLDEFRDNAERLVGHQASHYSLRKMKTRWGSCTHKTRRIRLNYQLALYEPRFLWYVLIHELCHIEVPNHGPAFYALMDRVLPSWKEARRELRRLSSDSLL